jgi:hypothetical protein
MLYMKLERTSDTTSPRFRSGFERRVGERGARTVQMRQSEARDQRVKGSFTDPAPNGRPDPTG